MVILHSSSNVCGFGQILDNQDIFAAYRLQKMYIKLITANGKMFPV